MGDDSKQPWALQPAIFTVIDKGETLRVKDVQRWVDERKQLLRRAREILQKHDGSPVSLYPHHATLVGIIRRLEEIRSIFASFNRERNRHADANINAMIAYFSDPKMMEGIDD